MGLTIHYALKTPKNTTEEQAIALISKLRQKALDLPFIEVSDIKIFRGDECDYSKQGRDETGQLKDPDSWLKIGAISYFDLPKRKTDEPNHHYSMDVMPDFIVGFSAYPAEGSESLEFSLCHYPDTVRANVRTNDGYRTFKTYKTKLKGYSSHGFCKTQYASNPECGGIPNFLKAHLLVIKMLDNAKELKILKSVSDEGDYWKKRDVQALANEVGSWNTFIAGMFGAIKDAAGQFGMAGQSEITNYPNFESLEFKGQNEQQNKLLEIIKTLTQKK